MPSILIIKTSSLGDVIHNLPVINDIRRAVPHAGIDWVVEDLYVDLLRLHPGISNIVPVALRRWRKDWRGEANVAERGSFRETLRKPAYDIVLDTQGLIKSALIARSARLTPAGSRVGFSFGSAREALASFFYDRRYSVDQRLHAVERLRSLAAQTFGYPHAGLPDFGLKVEPRSFRWLAGDAPYAVLLHATSRAEKAWSGENWRALAKRLGESGVVSVFPWGSESERLRAEEYASGIERSRVAPKLSLSEMAALLAGAKAVVGVDTGITHLSAALNVPTVGLFGATPRWRYAPYWTPRAINLGDKGVQPTLDSVVEALSNLGSLGVAGVAPAPFAHA